MSLQAETTKVEPDIVVVHLSGSVTLGAKEVGRQLRFASAGANVIRLFKNTRLDTVLPFDPTVAGACEHFTVGPKADEHTA